MSSRTPKPPKEDPAVRIARNRQMEELAELDEEENRRLKGLMTQRRGIRAFRSTAGRRSMTSRGGRPRGSSGNSLAPPNGAFFSDAARSGAPVDE